MRKAAGILLIVFGLLSSVEIPGGVVNAIAWGRATSIEEFIRIQLDMGAQMVLAGILLLVLIVGGGICALRKKAYWWAFSGAVCLIFAGIIAAAFQSYAAGVIIGGLYILPGLLAVIFLVKRKDEFLKLPPSEHKLVED